MRLILRKELTETVVAAIRMNAVTRPKIATPSGLKQMEDAAFGPICLPAFPGSAALPTGDAADGAGGGGVHMVMEAEEMEEKEKGNLMHAQHLTQSASRTQSLTVLF